MSIRALFPFFQNNNELIYLDSAATSQKPQSVIDAMTQYYQCQNANVHRSSFKAANELTASYENTRQLVADFIGAEAADNIVWTKGCTESINLVAYSWAQHHVESGDKIVVLGSEHHANFVPWQQLALNKGAHLEVTNIDEHGNVDIEHFDQLIQAKPTFVAIQHCSNALGNIHPVKQLVHLAKNAGATVLVDGAQAVAHLPIDVQDIGCDFYAFSAHKMYGPTGVGVLYIANQKKKEMRPFQYGGEMISHVSQTKTSFRAVPHLLETGTPNLAGIIGFNAAIKFLSKNRTKHTTELEQELYQSLVSKLLSIPQVRLIGDTKHNIGVCSFVIEGESVSDVGALLDQQNIAVRVGHHCAMPLMQSLQLDGTVRASLAIYNNQQDIDTFINGLKKTIELLEI